MNIEMKCCCGGVLQITEIVSDASSDIPKAVVAEWEKRHMRCVLPLEIHSDTLRDQLAPSSPYQGTLV